MTQFVLQIPAAGAGINVSLSNSAPESGETSSGGGFATGGVFKKGSGSFTTGPNESTGTVGYGLGGGTAAGGLACKKAQRCLKN